jgi:endonuclease/exonuclease/phosphatase (EEP) superfamily protein YafD
LEEVEFDARRDRSERAAALLAGIGWLIALPLLAVALLRLIAHDATFPLIVLNAITQWLYLPAWPVLVLAWWLRRRGLVACAAAVAALQLAWMAPGALFAEPAPATRGARLCVMSTNVLMVNEDTTGIVAEVEAARPDVLLVQELTSHWAAAFDTPALRQRLPHRMVIPQEDSFGIAVYSRLPFADSEVLWFDGLPAIRVDVTLGGQQVRILNVHTLPPRTHRYTERWNVMMEQLLGIVRGERGALILGGDLNATPHAAWYGRLLATGLRGAHESRGRGLASTWPNGRMSYPPIRLDHLLVSRELAVLGVREGEGRGSDHRPIVVDLALR